MEGLNLSQELAVMPAKEHKTWLPNNFAEKLKLIYFGQEGLVEAVLPYFQGAAAGISSEGRPLANLLLLGPTGCGKTRFVESLAQVLHGSMKKVLKIDCAEYQHNHEVAKLIGAPPGYLGHRETHPILTQEALSSQFSESCSVSFVLFDELEKASDSLWNLLLGIMDKGIMKTGDNRVVNFEKTFLFMTGNLGAREIEETLGGHGIGFPHSASGRTDVSGIGTRAARKCFTPEFFNRLDEVLTLKPLGTNELRSILDYELRLFELQVLEKTGGMRVLVSDEAREWILKQSKDPRYGARSLKRLVTREVRNKVAARMADGDYGDVEMRLEDNQLVCHCV